MAEERRRYGSSSLFSTERAKGRAAYKLFVASMLASICLVLAYRAAYMPGLGEQGRWPWIGMAAAEIWFAFYWIVTQSVRWNPIYRSTFKDRLALIDEADLPGVDVFVCTADPAAEPPALVISTVLSVMAYDYPPEKLSVYLSDDAGSQLTLYAMWEAARFARHWLPFCRRRGVEPRSPSAYFAGRGDHRDHCTDKERFYMKNLYEEMESRIDSVVMLEKIPDELKEQRGFSEWNNSGMTSRNHQPIVQILIDNNDKTSIDDDGRILPNLVYMAREKRPQHYHNFKAGAMNALLRVSSVISNSPVILNVDCDMFSNNADSIKDALCFFLDEEKGRDIGFVQYPQRFYNSTENDLYANAFKVINSVELSGLDSWGGPLYIGTGCFHRREVLCGRKHSKDYKEDWRRGIKRGKEDTAVLEERAKSLATCTFELNTQWGADVGVKYGCVVEDIITGLAIQCRGWKSAYFNPPRSGFLGVAPTTLAQTLVQHKRWSEGNFHIFFSKYCAFLYGHGRIKLGLQMGYSIYGMWAANSFPTLFYVTVPSLCLLRGVSLFPAVSSPWFVPFAFVTAAKHAYSLGESLACGDTLLGWWNIQRMWLLKRITSYLYGITDAFLKKLGMSKMAFVITGKVADADAGERFEREVMEFGPAASSMFVVIATTAVLNLLCFGVGLRRAVGSGGGELWVQVAVCGAVAALNLPVYEAMFWRKDKGRMTSSVTFTSIGLAAVTCLLSATA